MVGKIEVLLVEDVWVIVLRDPEMLLLFICYNLSQILCFTSFISNIFLEYMLYLTLLVILNSLLHPLQYKWRKI